MVEPFIPWWCSTAQACELLGVHESTLRRNRDRAGGRLLHGEHWIWLGPHWNSGVRWNVKQIRTDHKFNNAGGSNG